MRVIVVGAGRLAFALVGQISKENVNVDVVVIDKLESAVDSITDAYDCNGYVGNGANPELLKKAGIDSTSLFVALTKSDETNILCCSIAKTLGVKKTVAAVRGLEFNGDEQFFNALGVDKFVNPDLEAASDVNKQIRYTGELELEHFCDGEVSVATIKISEDSILAGLELTKVRASLDATVLICAIDRNGKLFTPDGNESVKVGDIITFAAIGKDMDHVLTKMGILRQNIQKTMIVGGGKIGRYLAKQLISEKVKVTILDNNVNQCELLMNEIPEANVICGDGTDTELMDKELRGMDACVAISGRDEENLIISMYAKASGMERIAAEIDNENYDSMLKKSGIKHTFSNRGVSVESIVCEARALIADEDDKDNNVIKWMYNFNHGKVEAVEFELTRDFSLLGIPFKSPKFKLKKGILIAAIVHEGVVVVPNGESVLSAGDSVIIISAEHKISKLTEIFG